MANYFIGGKMASSSSSSFGIGIFVAIGLVVLITMVQLVESLFYCYEVVRDINSTSNDCPPPLVYQPTVQFCCGQQPIPNATVQQTFDQIPLAGSPDAIPEGCERGLRFPSGTTRCRSGLMLRAVGRNQLCCAPNVQLPPSLTGGQGGQPGLVPGIRPQLPYTGPGAALSACVDLAAPGRASDCPARRHLCDDTVYRDLMTQQCPLTCRRCGARAALGGAQYANVPGGACVDRVGPNGKSDCPDREAYCRVPIYRSLMQQECAYTCKFCNPSGPAAAAALYARIVPPSFNLGGGGRGNPAEPNPILAPVPVPPPPPPASNNVVPPPNPTTAP